MAGILSLLAAAAAEGHDEAWLRTEVTARLIALRPRLPPEPAIPRRVHDRLMRPDRMNLLQIDGAVVAMAEVIGPGDGELWAELVALNLVAARLGALVCTHRLGQHVVTALRAVPVPKRRKISKRVRRTP